MRQRDSQAGRRAAQTEIRARIEALTGEVVQAALVARDVAGVGRFTRISQSSHTHFSSVRVRKWFLHWPPGPALMRDLSRLAHQVAGIRAS